MSLTIKEIINKNTWESFLSDCEERSFLNSWNWGEFQKIEANRWKGKIWRLGAYNNEKLVSVSLIVKIKAKRGTFLFVPHGPNIKEKEKDNKKEILNSFLKYLKKLSREENASFIRFSPVWERKKENIEIFKKMGFKKAPIHVHPEVTWVLNIQPAEEQILKEMRKNTRYEIRKSLKMEELKLIKSEEEKDVDLFNNLYKETSDRHKFTPFSLQYLTNQYKSFINDKEILIFHVKYKKDILSSAIVVFWQKTAFYHHGSSTLKYPKIPSSHLLQWEIIKEAKKRNCNFYNFWGVADIPEKELKNKRHPWAGLSIFKRGFGGSLKEYVKTQDFLMSQKYWFNYVIEIARRIKRNY